MSIDPASDPGPFARARESKVSRHQTHPAEADQLLTPMRTRLGRISRGTLALGLIIVSVIATGMIWPGRTGTIIETVGWLALAACIIFEIQALQSASGNRDYRGDRRYRNSDDES